MSFTTPNGKLRIDEIQLCKINGRNVKRFEAYRLENNAYVFAGFFSAPPKTADSNLHYYATTWTE